MHGFYYKAMKTGRGFDVGISIRTPRGEVVEMFGGNFKSWRKAKEVAATFNREVGFSE